MNTSSLRHLAPHEWMLPRPFRDPYVDRFFTLVFWCYFGATYVSYLLGSKEEFGTVPVTLAFLSLAVIWLLLPWNPRVSWRRLLVAPMFLLVSFVVVYLTGAGFSTGLYCIALANSAFLFGFRWTLVYAGALLPVIFASYTLDYSELGVRLALEYTGYWALQFAFVIAICTMAVNAVERSEHTQSLLKELESAHGELQRYADRVRELTTAEERARLAREIHDSLGHYLTIINVELEAAGKLLDRDVEQGRQEVARAKTLASEALADIRRSVRALKPLAVEERTGAAALRALVRGFGGAGMAVSFNVVGDERDLPPETALVFYRALQEGLTNALKHSGARRVRASLAFDPCVTRLTIADDGQGAPEGALLEHGFGLRGLRDRLEALNGTLTARNAASGGFVIEVELPMEAT